MVLFFSCWAWSLNLSKMESEIVQHTKIFWRSSFSQCTRDICETVKKERSLKTKMSEFGLEDLYFTIH